MLARSLVRAGWRVSDDRLSARLRSNRLLPGLLVVLVVAGGVMYGCFLSVTDGPYAWPAYVAPVALLSTLYAAIRALRSVEHLTFADGVFRCTSGALGFHTTESIALADLVRFEARGPTDYRDVAHIVAHLKGGLQQRLPIGVADAAPIRGMELALAIAVELNDMLEDTGRARTGYR